jgi:DNA-binding response OmpR family regulator
MTTDLRIFRSPSAWLGPGDVHLVLIIEDQVPTAEFLATVVQAMGLIAKIAYSLDEARAAIEEGGFCLVLLDTELRSEREDWR